MNQTQKRLSIIKLAISITDIETIQMQLLKLTPIKTDLKIQGILSLLNAGNYAQAQGLITDYIDSAPEEILQRTSQDEKQVISDDDQAIIDEFNLFVTPGSNATQGNNEVDINDYGSIKPKITKDKHTIDFDSILNLNADDVLKDNISIDISHNDNNVTVKDTFFQSEKEETFHLLSEDNPIKKDTFFEEEAQEEIREEIASFDDNHTVKGEENTTHETEILQENDRLDTPLSQEEIITSTYAPMPHIAQKFTRMKKQYLFDKLHLSMLFF